MDSKALKSALKAAVEHIRAEKFADTVRICKVSLYMFVLKDKYSLVTPHNKFSINYVFNYGK